MFHPRPYQLQCVQAGFDYYLNGGKGNQLFALPTGTGKSVIPPMFMRRAMTEYPSQRMLVLTHVKELIQQNYKALRTVWPTAPVTIYSAGMGVKEGHAPIVIGGVASVVNSMDQIGRRDLLWIDEAHLLSPDENSMYQQVIENLKQRNPFLKVIGLTATPFRMGQGMLTDNIIRGEKEVPSIFDDISFNLTGVEAFNKLIDDCYLMPLIPKQTHSVIDVTDVRLLANDFNQKDLSKAVERQGITGKALGEAYELCRNRKSWIVFGAGIKNCEQITAILNRMGVPTVCVHSKMSDDDREKGLNAFKQGYFRAIVSNNILTTGFDHPQIDAIIDLRPTTSIPLHIQKYGRGTRPYFPVWFTYEMLVHLHIRRQAIEEGGKLNCLVLDFAGNTARLGPINDPRIPNRKKGDGTGDVPVKICPECGAYNHTVVRTCINCGHEFVFKEKIKASASTADIIKKPDANIHYMNVDLMNAKIHQKPGKPDSLKVTYICGMKLCNVWLAFEGKGLAKHKAFEWWRQHHSDDVPATAQEAFNRFKECRKTGMIRCDFSGKYPEVLEFLF